MYVHHADVHAYIYSYQHVEEIQNFFFPSQELQRRSEAAGGI